MTFRQTVRIINPLKDTLAHFECELVETIQYSGQYDVEVVTTTQGDGITGLVHRVAVAANTIRERIDLARDISGEIIVVVWPLFGYFDPLTLMTLARRNTLYLIVHDPTPLRRSFGQAASARKLFRAIVRRSGVRVIYHTANAQQVGIRQTGIAGTVVPHPITSRSPVPRPPFANGSRPVVRVLGQYKPTRSLAALVHIADGSAGSVCLQIWGRGWPAVPGWEVQDRFVPEAEFTALIQSSDCVVVPYDAFFQSGVAVRCLESGIPVVAPRHDHIAELYGNDWPGIVEAPSDWYSALIRALAVNRPELASRRDAVAQAVHEAWRELLLTP